ncbi:MAG TPA: flagellar hook-length control protein FliK [Chromobacteriaceae bacterium]|nr:flagellar hook-length control protein FliK [Chromobacteriaceae bacterium]
MAEPVDSAATDVAKVPQAAGVQPPDAVALIPVAVVDERVTMPQVASALSAEPEGAHSLTSANPKTARHDEPASEDSLADVSLLSWLPGMSAPPSVITPTAVVADGKAGTPDLSQLAGRQMVMPPSAGVGKAAEQTVAELASSANLASRRELQPASVPELPQTAAMQAPPLASLVPAAVAAPLSAAEWAPVKLPTASPQQWGPTLLTALGDRVSVQLNHGIDNAVIRLDPPMFGSLEIAIRHQAGGLQVQLTASNSEVVSQLQHISDKIRQDLAGRQFTDVAVVVADSRTQGFGDGRQSREQPAAQQEQGKPGRALSARSQQEGDAHFSLAQASE